LYTAWSEDNKLQAYAVEGKGADLTGYVHEWGGGVSKLLPLFAYANQERGKALTIMAPLHASNLIRRLVEFGATENHGVLGMIKLLNPAGFLTKIKKYLRAMGIDDLIIEYREGLYYLGYKGHIFKTDSERDVVRLVFGPLKASELHPFDKETSAAYEQVLPIPMWIWGWDSV
jgi:hypothetical protein